MIWLKAPVCRIVAFSGQDADCNQLNTLHLTLSFQVCRRYYGGYETLEKCKRPSVGPVFSLSVLGCRRHMVVQHGSLCWGGPMDIKVSSHNHKHNDVGKPDQSSISRRHIQGSSFKITTKSRAAKNIQYKKDN